MSRLSRAPIHVRPMEMASISNPIIHAENRYRDLKEQRDHGIMLYAIINPVMVCLL